MATRIAPSIVESKITLNYPLYCYDFNLQDSNRLFIGSSGGAGCNGI